MAKSFFNFESARGAKYREYGIFRHAMVQNSLEGEQTSPFLVVLNRSVLVCLFYP